MVFDLDSRVSEINRERISSALIHNAAVTRKVICDTCQRGCSFKIVYLQPQATMFTVAYCLAIMASILIFERTSNRRFYLRIDERNNLALEMSGVRVGS
jgi:hypothetical protein